MEEKRIYIADDDSNIREGIKAFLENEGYQVEAFADGQSLYDAFSEKSADLLVLDIMMPKMDGFTVCEKIRKKSTVPIIMLTARDSDLDYVRGIMLGSDDYFTKPFSPTALVMRVKAIFRRIAFEKDKAEEKTEEDLLHFGSITMDKRAKRVVNKTEEISLTPNEYDVLRYLMEHPGQAVSRDELLTGVWGCEVNIEIKVTDDTVRRLRKKMENTNVQIETVWGYGFRLKGGEHQ